MKSEMGLPTIGTLFRRAGYVTAAFGKVHVAGESEECDLGFDERALRIYTKMENDYQHTVGLEKFWKYCSYIPSYKPHPEAESRNSYNPQNVPIELDEEDLLDSLVADRSIEFLERNQDRPFFLWVGFEKPHNEMYAPKRFHDLYEPRTISLPENLYNSRENLPDTIFDNPDFPINTEGAYTDAELQNCLAAYYANVSFMDAQAGRVLDAMDRLGLAENTLVVYASDHGENLFNHQMVQKQCFFEEAVRTPLTVRLPEKKFAGTTRDQLASLLDLLPTFCDSAEIEVPPDLDGASLLPAIHENAPLRDAVFSEFYEYGAAERMIRTGRWKYVHSEGDRHQLYDLEKDPAENRNLIDDPQHRETAAWLDDWLCRDWDRPDTSLIPKKRGDTRPGQKHDPARLAPLQNSAS